MQKALIIALFIVIVVGGYAILHEKKLQEENVANMATYGEQQD